MKKDLVVLQREIALRNIHKNNALVFAQRLATSGIGGQLHCRKPNVNHIKSVFETVNRKKNLLSGTRPPAILALSLAFQSFPVDSP